MPPKKRKQPDGDAPTKRAGVQAKLSFGGTALVATPTILNTKGLLTLAGAVASPSLVGRSLIKLASWNVAGIAACAKKGLMACVEAVDADILCRRLC
jgi:hypothetical protein